MRSVPVVIPVDTTGLTSVTTGKSATVTSAAQFGSVVAGQYVYGPGISIGTRVKSKETSSSITLDRPALVTQASAALRYGYFTSLAYADGDALGFPVEVPLRTIHNIVIIDKQKTLASVDAWFFMTPWVTPTVDNVAFAPDDVDVLSICGKVLVATQTILANNHVLTIADAQLPIGPVGNYPKLYCQFAAKAAATFGAATDMVAVFIGEE